MFVTAFIENDNIRTFYFCNVVEKHVSCNGKYCCSYFCKFLADPNSERILKIGLRGLSNDVTYTCIIYAWNQQRYIDYALVSSDMDVSEFDVLEPSINFSDISRWLCLASSP